MSAQNITADWASISEEQVMAAVKAGSVDHVLSLLVRLPDAQREVIMLAFYGELSHTEIAARLDLPPGTVKGRIRLGLQRLRVGIQR